jgi:hypothetical protein
MSVLFKGPCAYCSATNYSLSSCGEKVCPRCETAIGIAGVRPPDVTFEQYRDVILEVVAATDLAPRSPPSTGETINALAANAAIAVAPQTVLIFFCGIQGAWWTK